MATLKAISQPLPYTSSPLLLALQDIWLFLRITFVWPVTKGIPSIVIPFYPSQSGPLDELYPSFQNIKALVLHAILVVAQAAFLLVLVPSLLFGVPVPLLGWTPSCLLIVSGFVVLNNWFCILLNGTKRRYQSVVDPCWKKHDNEKWIFINGVAVGDHWMQSNIDRLALTFRRPIHGIHNMTKGIIFDVIECIIQRTFNYATPDVRDVYADLNSFIEEQLNGGERYNRVVLILHSQGAVEGGLVLDWLFATLGQELLSKVEIYTFGSAANHFNSPETREGQRVVKHIEHYANLGDYVSLFGILHFRPLPKLGKGFYQSRAAREEIENRYVGKLFVRKGSGHQFNGNYLDNFFTMEMTDKNRLTVVKEDNDFMSGEVNKEIYRDYDIVSKAADGDVWDCQSRDASNQQVNGTSSTKIKNFSRLWQYRNGMVPDEGGRAATWPISLEPQDSKS